MSTTVVLTRKDRLRRVVIVCAHFSRNLAYYRAGHSALPKVSPQFWITLDGNFIDIAILEWCKLFADKNGKHSWTKVVTDSARFERELLHRLSVTSAEFSHYVVEMRVYRDKFLAHLDDLPVMNIPFLDRAYSAVEFYHRHIVSREAGAADLAGLPTDLSDYYHYSANEADAIYHKLDVLGLRNLP
jgi:hypothetical protein